MPGPFAITAAYRNVVLQEGQRSAEISFTVCNVCGHPVRARAVAVPDGPTQAQWLQLSSPDRYYEVDCLEEIKVVIALPAEAAPGEYPVRLTVADLRDPDDQSSHSDQVRFVLPEPPPPPPKPSPWPMVLGIGGAVLGLVMLVVILVATL